jgi:NitT/TauT family transport system permease protein
MAATTMTPTAPNAAAPRASAAAARRTVLRWTIQVLSLVACVVLWHFAATHKVNLGVVTFQNVPPPSEVVDAAVDLLASPKLAQHLSSSLLRIAFGVGLGLAIGRANWARLTLLPPLEVARPIPAVAWIPLSILMFPSSEGSMVFITFVGAVFPILLNTIHGVHGVDPRLIASARSLGTKRWALFAQVILPSSAPSIVTGLSIGMGTCWFCLVTAEMISGQYGIGYYTWESYTVQNYANIVVGMLLIGALGMGSSALIHWGGGRLMPWYQPAGGKA